MRESGRRWGRAAMAIATAALAATMVACELVGPPADRAEQLASDWIAKAAERGATFRNIQVDGATDETRDGRTGWTVEASAEHVAAGGPDGLRYDRVAFVDGETGAITVVAQG